MLLTAGFLSCALGIAPIFIDRSIPVQHSVPFHPRYTLGKHGHSSMPTRSSISWRGGASWFCYFKNYALRLTGRHTCHPSCHHDVAASCSAFDLGLSHRDFPALFPACCRRVFPLWTALHSVYIKTMWMICADDHADNFRTFAMHCRMCETHLFHCPESISLGRL